MSTDNDLCERLYTVTWSCVPRMGISRPWCETERVAMGDGRLRVGHSVILSEAKDLTI